MTQFTPFDADERALARALHGKVDQMNDAPVGLAEVTSRAQVIRCRRRVVVAASLTAAAVVVVPMAVLAGGALRPDATPPVSSPSPTPSAEVMLPATMPFDLANVPTGEPPAVDYAEGSTIHAADGRTVEVGGVAGIDELAAMGDGWVAAVSDNSGNREAVRIGPDGAVSDRVPLDGSLAISSAGSVVAWAGPDGSVTVVESDGAETLKMPPITAPGPYSAVAVTSEDCVEGRSSDAGCAVIVNTSGQRQQVYQSTSHGDVDVLPGFTKVTAYRGLTAGITRVRFDTTACSRVVAPTDGSALWRSCDLQIPSLSPLAKHAVAWSSQSDGLGASDLALVTATRGDPVFHLISDEDHQVTVLQTTWEDDSHVLAEVYFDGQWGVLRVGAARTLDWAIPPVSGGDVDPPYALQLR
ncbi:MAG: hypothetical protein QM714_18100 [Nocardioides sp.]|uniref:hypothetical protein n=1 Tax=Nocardioides sp. TaxID=35761 RepID=UPI0039E3B957